jgi:hypothetical protein
MDFGSVSSAFSQIPLDWILVVIFFVVIAADALRAGPVRAGAIAISLPLSALLYQMIPQTVLLSSISSQFPKSFEQALLFAILEIILFVCFNQLLYSFESHSSLLSAVVCGLCATVVVLVVWTQVPVLQSLWHFDSQIVAIFGASYRFFWLIGSYLALAFIGA